MEPDKQAENRGGRCQPGQSGNPKGRPKGSTKFAQACRAVLGEVVPDGEGETYAVGIARALADRAIHGDVRAAEFLADRAEGKVPQGLLTTSADTDLDDVLSRMTVGELQEFATTGTLPAWAQEEELDDNEAQPSQGAGPAATDEPKSAAELPDRI